MVDSSDPFVQQKTFEYISAAARVAYTPRIAWAFIKHLLASKQLAIGPELEKFTPLDSFFLVAGTGLGKTVIMPVYLWFRHMYMLRYYPTVAREAVVPQEDAPRIWVVEPSISIVQGLHAEMNAEWDRWQSAAKIVGRHVAPFGCKTRVDHRNVDAPIMFITTGIFAIYARKGMFRPNHDVVVIDEAHVTLEADESVELAVGICHASSVAVQYMSATVKWDDLPKRLGVTVVEIPGKRFPVWRHNTGLPLEECIVPLVEMALIQQERSSEFFPQGEAEQVILESVRESGRAKGMLVIVKSFTGEHSDARRIERLLQGSPFSRRFEIGLLASETLRDRNRKAAYEAMLERWKREKKRYVLIATSVVEMGVTLPDLDFVVTMDAGFGDADGGRLAHVALGTNALLQRIGRVGRQRPGIAYITRDRGAPYSDWDDATLNSADALLPEPIRFPMEKGSLTWLAYESMARKWNDNVVAKGLETFRLPTDVQANPERLQQLQNERIRLWGLGIHDGREITLIGRQLERWIGRMDPAHAAAAHVAYSRGNLEWVLHALSEGVLQEYPLDAACDPERFKEAEGEDVVDADIYRCFVIDLTYWLSGTNASWHDQYRLMDQIQTTFVAWNVQEQTYFHALALLAEHIETFVEIVGEKKNLDVIKLAPLRAWRETIRTFLKMRTST